MRKISLYPILCNYCLTTRCNARCTFCDIHQKKGLDAKTEEVLCNLKDLKKLGVRFIDFTGGEPLLHPHLPEILREAKRLQFLTTLTTNCVLYPKLAHKIIGLVNYLHFSLDSPHPEEHDAIRGVVCFDRVMESLKVAEALGEKPDILFTVTNQNVRRLPEMVRFAQSLRRILLLNPVFSYFDNEGVSQQTLDAVLAAASLPYVYVNRGILRLMKIGGNRSNRPRCRAVTTTVVISPDNHLLLPCYHRAVRKIPINGNLLKIRRSRTAEHFRRREGRFPSCEGCTISCYLDPSFTYGLDDYFLLSQLSKMKYVWDKYVREPVESIIKNKK